MAPASTRFWRSSRCGSTVSKNPVRPLDDSSTHSRIYLASYSRVDPNREDSDVIQSTIVNRLLDDDLVIADLTEHNPNVLFELGMRMAFDKPTVLIKAKGTRAIFDVDNMLRVFEYDPALWTSTVESDVPNLAVFVRASWANRNEENTYLRILKRSPASD